MYQIWEYFPKEAREYAASLTYQPTLNECKATIEPRATLDDGMVVCPLGAAFTWCEEHLHWTISDDSFVPEPMDAARVIYVNLYVAPTERSHFLFGHSEQPKAVDAIVAQARLFIQPFDDRVIPMSLGEALGI